MPIGLPIVSKFDDKGVKDAGKAISDFGGTLKKIAGLVAAAFAIDKIKDFAMGAIEAAEGVQVANNRLGAIAESMNLFGAETEAVTQRMIEFAEANELSLATDAELIKATQAKLLTFKELAKSADETGGAFDRATLAAIDLAAAGFGEATSNATQLGKALQDPIKGISALTRVGVTFTAEQKNLIEQMVASNDVLGAQDLILSAIEEQVGGTAEATATASERMNLAFGNVNEAIGEALLPTFEDLTEILIPLIEDITPELQKFFEDIAPLVGDAVEAFGGFAKDALPGASTFLGDLSGALKDIGERLGPIMEEDMLPALQTIFEDLSEPVGEVVEFLTTLAETILAQISEILADPEFQEAIANVGEGFGNLANELTRMIETDAVQFLLDLTGPAIAGSVNILATAVDLLASALWALNGALEALSGKAPTFESIDEFLEMDLFGTLFGDLIKGTQENMMRQFRGFAEGGIVRPMAGGTPAIIGERGESEVVLPLSKLPQLISDMQGSGAQYVINIQAGVGSDPVAIGRYVTDAIKRYENVSGKVFARA